MFGYNYSLMRKMKKGQQWINLKLIMKQCMSVLSKIIFFDVDLYSMLVIIGSNRYIY